MPSEQESREVAARMMACIQAGDVEGMEALYHDDIVVWRNGDNRELVKKQALKVVKFLATLLNLSYDNVRVTPTPDGFAQQHDLCCTAPDGTEVRVHAAFIAKVESGRILRVDEYADGAQMAPLMG